MGTRRVTTVTLVALFLCTSACLVTAQSVAMEPVGEVEDHPPAAIVKDFDSPSDALGSVPEENMQSLFNWAIENSDPARLREMAEETKMGGGAVGVGAGPVIGLGILDRLGKAGRLGSGIYDMPVDPFSAAVSALKK